MTTDWLRRSLVLVGGGREGQSACETISSGWTTPLGDHTTALLICPVVEWFSGGKGECKLRVFGNVVTFSVRMRLVAPYLLTFYFGFYKLCSFSKIG